MFDKVSISNIATIHLSDPPSGGAQQVQLVLTPPVGRVDHRDPPPQLRGPGVPGRLLVHGVKALLQHLPGLLQRLLVAVPPGRHLQQP